MLLLQLVDLKPGQAAKGQLEDCLRLDHAQRELLDQPGAGGFNVTRAPDQLDHFLDALQRYQQTLDDVGALFLLAQLELRAADDHLALVIDVVAQDLDQRKGPRHVVNQRDRIHTEGGLERGVLVQLVQHNLGDRVALQLDHQSHAVAIGLVAQVADLSDLLVGDEVLDLVD